MSRDGTAVSFSIDVQPVPSDSGGLLLVCFVEAPKDEHDSRGEAVGAAGRFAGRRT